MSTRGMHSLLARQLRKVGLDPSGSMADLVRLVDAAYQQYDDERRMLERSLELSSRELLGANSDLRALLGSLPDLFVRLDDRGVISDLQGAAPQDYFPDATSIVGRAFATLVDPASRASVDDAITAARHDGQQRTLEFQVTGGDGTVGTFEGRFMRVFEHQVIALVRNITAVKAAARAREERTALLLRQQAALHELAAAEDDDPAATFGRACTVAARTLGVARASIWYYDPARADIRCAWLYNQGELQQNPGIILRRDDYPRYFEAIESQPTVAAGDARRDPRTSEFAEGYLEPLGIGAMLDCAIRVGGNAVGVFCLEHVGAPRPWALEEQDFASAVASFIALSRSIEQRNDLEAQLRHAQKMEAVGMLAGGVAHDFNNLLTAILGFAELLRANTRLDPLAHSHVSEIVMAGKRASELTSQLLAFGRKQPRAPRLIGLNAVIADASRMLHRVVGEAITIHLSPNPVELVVRADPNQVEQVLMNLVVNARDAMERGGTIQVRTRSLHVEGDPTGSGPALAPGDWAVLEVEDTGTGMSPELLGRVFEPFFTTKGVGEGTGLGLSMVYGLVQQNGGHVELGSVPGRGTTARVYLPVEAPPVSVAPQPILHPVAEPRPAGGSETVLLVEDEAIVRLLAVELLQRLGYRVLVAARPSEALEILGDRTEEIDLLITDLVMPEMNGAELYQAAARARPGLRVMYMSGYAPDKILRETVQKPGTFFLAKPFTMRQLADRVRDALQAAAPVEQLTHAR
ncbi:MAG: response regulator [Gemmatimonadetes bacterium]|nr:response regulator [Gemmatimonadota bacterium]